MEKIGDNDRVNVDDDCGGGGGGGDCGGDEDNETDKLGVAMPLVALVVTEGSGSLYLIKVAVRGSATAGGGVGGGATVGGGGAAGGAGGAALGAGGAAVVAGGAATFLKIIRLFRILINPRSNVRNPFNISFVDEIYDSTKL